MASKVFKADDNNVIKVGSRTNKMILNLFQNNKFKNLMYIQNIGATKKYIFFTFNVKKRFNTLKQAFIKALIF